VDANAQGIVDAALKLPLRQRAEVVQQLLDSLGDAEMLVDDVWAMELDRRLSELEAGEATVVSWSDLRRQR